MNQQATPSDTDQQQALEAFLRDGGTLAMLRGLSEDTLEQLYALGFNQYQAGKWDDAQKIFQALCMLDHYLSLIHISEPTRPVCSSRMPSSA